MRIYTQTFKCSENFPVAWGDEWSVREGRKVVEHWRVIRTSKASFDVAIKEFVTVA